MALLTYDGRNCGFEFFGGAQVFNANQARSVAAHIGRKVQQRRLELGLSSETVADAMHINHSVLSDLECGKSNFTADEILSLCGILVVVPSWFFEELL